MGAREDMIDAAERLAAERGIAAMTLREVQKAAGQRNKSAAQYHFGDRQGLIAAIVSTRMAPINEARLERLAELDERDAPATTRDLVEVLVEPLAEATLRRGSCWARFLVQGWSDPALSEVVRRNFEGRGYRDTRARLVDGLGHGVPEELRERRVDHAIGLLVTSLAASEANIAAGGRRHLGVESAVADLVDICTAVLEVPASPRTRRSLSDPSARTA